MKVVSKLAEVDFEVDRIQSHKLGIVVLNDPEKSMSTKVLVTPEDGVSIARAILTSGAGLKFILSFPFIVLYRKLTGKDARPRKKP